MEYIKRNKKKIVLFVLVFLLSSLWITSLTYNFNFLWEDWSFSPYFTAEEGRNPASVTMDAIKVILNPNNVLFVASYAYRPLVDSWFIFLPTLFGSNIIYYKIFKIILAGILAVLCFRFFISKETTFDSENTFQIIVGIFGLSYLLVLPEFWIFSLYLIDTMLPAYLLEVLALWLFFFHYLTDNASPKKYVILFFFIVLFTHVSTLIRHFGRINFLLIFLFLLFTDRKKLFSKRMLVLIFTLFIISVPVLGILTTGDILGTTGIESQTGAEGFGQFIVKNLEYFKTIHLAFLQHAVFLVILAVIFLVLHIYAWRKKQKDEKAENQQEYAALKQIVIFTFLWFIISSYIVFIGRGFVHDRTSFLRFQFTVFIIPQALFLISYSLYVYKKYFSAKKIVQYALLFFILLAILHNTVRLNEWRGGWGAYFLGYDTVRQYVDDNAEHAVLIFPFDHASPTYFIAPSTNTQGMEQEQTNTTLLLLYKQNYTRVFITNRYELSFNESFVVNVENLSITDTSPYGIVKKALGKYYKDTMYVYEVKP